MDRGNNALLGEKTDLCGHFLMQHRQPMQGSEASLLALIQELQRQRVHRRLIVEGILCGRVRFSASIAEGVVAILGMDCGLLLLLMMMQLEFVDKSVEVGHPILGRSPIRHCSGCCRRKSRRVDGKRNCVHLAARIDAEPGCRFPSTVSLSRSVARCGCLCLLRWRRSWL